jgi:hypothetical protein
MANYPCGNGKKNCTRTCVYCEKCETWFHIRYQKLNKDQFTVLNKSQNCDFICTQCCKSTDDRFDYTLSLASLESYANRNLLVEGVQVEKILLHNEPLTQIINETNHVYSAQSCLIEDRVSKQILNEHKMCIKDRKPIQVSSDGNCLFNSLSLDIVGNESLAPRLRVLTCIELVSN